MPISTPFWIPQSCDCYRKMYCRWKYFSYLINKTSPTNSSLPTKVPLVRTVGVSGKAVRAIFSRNWFTVWIGDANPSSQKLSIFNFPLQELLMKLRLWSTWLWPLTLCHWVYNIDHRWWVTRKLFLPLQ